LQTSLSKGSGAWVVLALSGDVDLASASDLRMLLVELGGSAPAFVVLDLAELEFIDSTGLGVLVGALRGLRAAGGDLRIAGARAGIARVLSVTELNRVFEQFLSVDDAMAQPVEGPARA